MSVVLILDFLLAKKWLILEPSLPQSLKTIYRVLKFVANMKRCFELLHVKASGLFHIQFFVVWYGLDCLV